MLRAIRFSTQLGFRIEDSNVKSIRRNAERLKDHHARTDPYRIAQDHHVRQTLQRVQAFGQRRFAAPAFFPELSNLKGIEWRDGIGHKDNFYHTLEVLDNVAENSDNLWLRWSALLHDIAKPATKRFQKKHGWTFHGHEDRGARMVPKIFKRMKLPLDQKMKFVQKMVLLHLRPIALTKNQITDSAVRRLLFDAGDDIDALMILCRADITSKNEAKVKRYLANYDVVLDEIEGC